jgi:Rrf2 family protein
MRIELGRTGDYAVRATLALAIGGRRMKAREIAEAMHLPRSFVPQILGLLARAGIVRSIAGPDGGYELTRPAGQVTLLQVIEAAEPQRASMCVLRGGPCRLDGTCAVHDSWFEARRALENKLARTTFAQLRARMEP